MTQTQGICEIESRRAELSNVGEIILAFHILPKYTNLPVATQRTRSWSKSVTILLLG